MPAAQTLFALAAVNGGFDGDALAGNQIVDVVANFDDCAAAFVTDDEGKVHDEGSDAAGGVIMNVRAENSDRLHAQQHIMRMNDSGIRRIRNLDFAQTGKKRRLHGTPARRASR